MPCERRSLPAGVELAEPGSAHEAATLLARAAGDGRAVVILGSGSRLDWQPALPASALAVSTLQLPGDLDLHAENLTASVSSALALGEVRRRLEEEGFWLPLMHVDDPEATLGGCLAAGFSNPLRLGYGLPRDWVLGLDVISGAGRPMKLGGELVKNVAGYDMVKLHLGAWGRTGLLTRAVLRLLPFPRAQATVEVRLPSAAAVDEAVHVALHDTSRPCALEVAGVPDDWLLLAWLVGDETGVAPRAAALAEELGGGVVHREEEHVAAWRAYAAGRRPPAGSAGGTRFKVSLRLPAAQRLESLLNAHVGPGDWSLSGHAGSGVFTVFVAEGGTTDGFLERALLLRRALAAGEHLMLEGSAAASCTGVAGWCSFPPRAPRTQDALEDAVVRALTTGGRLNLHLPLPGDRVPGGTLIGAKASGRDVDHGDAV